MSYLSGYRDALDDVRAILDEEGVEGEAVERVEKLAKAVSLRELEKSI